MQKKPRILAIIPARGGSKGIKNKNIIKVNEKPLISWTIEASLNSAYISRTVVSSDDENIISVAKSLGCDTPFKRPKELAQDHTPSIDVVTHALKKLKNFDYVILLQPTSPLRDSEDIDKAIELMLEKKSKSCASVTLVKKSPYWMYKINEKNLKLTNIIKSDKEYLRRQDLPDVYALNGAIYINEVEELNKTQKLVSDKTIGYIMPHAKSLDIDNLEDLDNFKRFL